MKWKAKDCKIQMVEIYVDSIEIEKKQLNKYKDLMFLKGLLEEVRNWLLQSKTEKNVAGKNEYDQFSVDGFVGNVSQKWTHIEEITAKLNEDENFAKDHV